MATISSQLEESFVKFSKHIPRILRKQILSDFLNQLLRQTKKGQTFSADDYECDQLSNTIVDDPLDADVDRANSPNYDPKCCRPTIERFHGTLLFVDISGFTILSQKLTPDRLRSFINAYFKRLIDIVQKYDGEVVKFAGDALFIIWQTKVNSLDDENFNEKCADGVRSAIACGMEINRTCSNYKVPLAENNSYHSEIIKNIKESDAIFANHQHDEFRKTKSIAAGPQHLSEIVASKEDFAYLNVHSGLSIGVMACMDVGFRDRWECLLLGSPLQDVAVAEGEAGQGELVISSNAHDYLHVSGRDTCENVGLCDSFGCIPLKSGCFKVTKIPKKKLYAVRLMSDSVDEVEDEVAYGSMVLKESDLEILEVTKVLEQNLMSLPNGGKGCNGKQRDDLLLVKLIKMSLLDDILRHVHQASRGNYNFFCLPRQLDYCCSDSKSDTNDNDMEFEHSEDNVKDIVHKRNFVDKIRDGIGSKFFHLKQQFQGGKNVRLAIDDNLLLSELREVIVMFINLHFPPIELVGDACGNSSDDVPLSTSPIDSFHFLKRTKNQLKQDRAILYVIQNCMKTMTDVMKRHGGQLRQFIIDDKGTVGIGTWGLKGSMSNDVAADALQSARELVSSMQDIGVPVSIGLTSGQVYCGLVGSPIRHEFAVMGPSVNLSARLMGKCKENEILCDAVIRGRDRAHLYVPFAKLSAKGYSLPVETFRPVFQQGSLVFKKAPTLKQLSQALSNLEINGKGGASEVVIDGDQDTKMKKLQKVSRAIGMLQVASKVTNGTKVHKRRRKLRASHIISVGMKRMSGRDEQVALIISKVAPNQESVDELAMNMSIIDAVASLSIVSKNFMDDSGQRFFEPTTLPSKVIIVSGSSGIGKSFLTSNITFNLLKLAVTRQYWNILVYSNVSGSNVSRMIEPFSSWKAIFLGILADYYNHSNGGGGGGALAANDDPRRFRRTSNSSGVSAAANSLTNILAQEKRKQALHGFSMIQPMLPPYLQNKGSLLNCISSIFAEKHDDASSLVGSQRITATFEILVAVLNIIRNERNCVIFFHMEDLHEMDSSSLRLMKKLWETMTGVIFLCTRTNKSPTFSQPKRDIIESNRVDDSEVFSLFFSPEPLTSNVTIVELENLSREATFALTEETLRYYEIHECSGQVLDQVYAVSGGNPLYAFEMSKALGQSYRQLMIFNLQQGSLQALSSDECTSTKLTVGNFSTPSGSDKHFQSAATGGGGIMDQIDHIIHNLHISRIEEVIHFRFDQLSTICQYLLKFISVACANGYHASLPLLAHMVTSSDIAELTDLFANCSDEAEVMLEIVKLLEEVFIIDVFLVLAPIKLHFTDREVLLLDEIDPPTTIGDVSSLNIFSDVESSTDRLVHSSVQNALSSSAIIWDDVDVNTGVNMTRSIEGLTMNNSTHRNTAGSILDQINRDNIGAYCIYFDVELERKSIYDIMIEEQKTSLHGIIATFLDNHPPTADHHDELQAHIFEEGFHWENARVWDLAMVCYFQSGMILDKMGLSNDSRRHLLLAYVMFTKMRYETDALSVPVASETASGTISGKSSFASINMLDRFQGHFNQMLGPFDSEETTPLGGGTGGLLIPVAGGGESSAHSFMRSPIGGGSATHSFIKSQTGVSYTPSFHANSMKTTAGKGKKTIRKIDLYHVFGGDCSLLHISLQMIFRLAHSCYKLDSDPSIVSRLLEEAMEIISVVKVDQLVRSYPNVRRPSMEVGMSALMNKNSSQRLYVKEIADINRFTITNVAVCFPILMSVLMLCFTKKSVMAFDECDDQDNLARESAACDLFIKLLVTTTTSSCSTESHSVVNANLDSAIHDNRSIKMHQAVGYILQRHLAHARGKYYAGIELIDQTKALYSFEDFHKDLIIHYGFDIIPQAFAMNFQVCLLLGDEARSKVYHELLCTMQKKINHLDTLMTLSLPLTVALISVNEIEEGYQIFKHYMDIEAQQSMVFSQFRFYSKIYWLMVMMTHEERRLLLNDGIGVSFQEEIVKLLDVYLPDIIAKKFMIFPFSDRKNILFLASFFGFSMEYACAQILFLYAKYLIRILLEGLDGVALNGQNGSQVASLCKQYLEIADEYLWYCIKSSTAHSCEGHRILSFSDALSFIGRVEVNAFHMEYFNLLHGDSSHRFNDEAKTTPDNTNIKFENHEGDRLRLLSDVQESFKVLHNNAQSYDLKFIMERLNKWKTDWKFLDNA